MGRLSSEPRGDRHTGGAAKPADDDGQHGRYDDDRAAWGNRGGRRGPMRTVFVADVLRILGLCGRRHAVFLAVLGRER